jgi:hypothetical protein
MEKNSKFFVDQASKYIMADSMSSKLLDADDAGMDLPDDCPTDLEDQE